MSGAIAKRRSRVVSFHVAFEHYGGIRSTIPPYALLLLCLVIKNGPHISPTMKYSDYCKWPRCRIIDNQIREH